MSPAPTIITPWVRLPQPDGTILFRPGRPEIQEDEIGTAEAARILGLSQRRVAMICDEGVFVEGRDWRKNASLSGCGKFRIKRAAVLRMLNAESEVKPTKSK